MAFESLTICMELVTFYGSDVDTVAVVDTTHDRKVIVTVIIDNCGAGSKSPIYHRRSQDPGVSLRVCTLHTLFSSKNVELFSHTSLPLKLTTRPAQ